MSFLVDQDGIIRWAHAGPRLHPSPDGRHRQAEADLRELASVVRRLRTTE